MWANRLNVQDESAGLRQPGAGAFMVVPAAMVGMLAVVPSPQQLYQWAFDRARQEVDRQRTIRCPELFANLN